MALPYFDQTDGRKSTGNASLKQDKITTELDVGVY